MLKIKLENFYDERLVWRERVGNEVPQKRKINAPLKWNAKSIGRVPKGDDKYKLIIQKQVMVEYPDGTLRKETRCINWKTLSRHVRDRDKKCVKCGSERNLEADHFHPNCYMWINWFFRPNKIQTLCSMCHTDLPSMKTRAENWKKYRWVK